MDAAEQLFAQKGFTATTIRAIAEAAGANIGALHYYWGSKEALFRAVCERGLRPVIEKRLLNFDACVSASHDGMPAVEAILRAYLEPALERDKEDKARRASFRKLMAAALSDPSPEVKGAIADMIDTSSFRLVDLLRQACGHLDDRSFFWRLHGVLGMMQHANAGGERIHYLSCGKFEEADTGFGIDEIVHSLAAALAAPTREIATVADGLQAASRRRSGLAAQGKKNVKKSK